MSILGKKPIGTLAYMGGVVAVLEKFTWAWGQIIKCSCEQLETPDTYIHLDRSTISDHGPARNMLAARFLGDWLLQLDTDHNPEPDVLVRMVRLIEEVERDMPDYPIDVLTGIYLYKQPPHIPLLYRWVGMENDNPMAQPLVEWDPAAKIIQIGSAGGGCLWVRRSVFDRIAAAGEQPFTKIGGLSEDHSFFLRCHRLGIKCYAATRIESPHVQIRDVTMDQIPAGLTGERYKVDGIG